MICDRLEHFERYRGISQGLSRALETLAGGSLDNAEPGRYEIDGDRVFALVQRYTTRPLDQCKLESHRRYIDVQAVLGGEEAMGHAQVSALSVSKSYEEEGDYALYHPYDAMSWLKLGPGEFAVFFPHDGHMPCCQHSGPSEVRKIVVKVRVE